MVDETGKSEKYIRTELDPLKFGPEVRQFRESLEAGVVGQPEAIDSLVFSYQMHKSRLADTNKPIASMLYLGQTGSGKTHIIETAASILFQTKNAVLKVNCAEFAHSHEVAKLIGSPPGYLGHKETPPLFSQETINKFHTEDEKLTFVLFDEIEKADDTLWQLMLGILDKASLTLGDNREVSFENCIIAMTSNLGAKDIEKLITPMGFQPDKEGPSHAQKERTAVGAARKKFTPEFMNRIDYYVVFNSLSEDSLRKIVDLELHAVQGRIFFSEKVPNFAVAWGDDAKEFLLERGTDKRYGARPLKRAIERHVMIPLANIVMTEQIDGSCVLEVSERNGELVFTKVQIKDKIIIAPVPDLDSGAD